jgi:hypothetical protein
VTGAQHSRCLKIDARRLIEATQVCCVASN